MANAEAVAIARAGSTGGDPSYIRVFNEALENAGGPAVGKRELKRRLAVASHAVSKEKGRQFLIELHSTVIERAGPLFRQFGIGEVEAREIAEESDWYVSRIQKKIAERMSENDAEEFDSIQPMHVDMRGSLAAEMKKRFED